MSTVIKVENLSKQYRLGVVDTNTFKEDTKRFWARLRGKQDPFSIVGDENDRTNKGSSDFVWSLRDLNFEVNKGDVLGVIGRNGAGKSTLLKILSKVTAPTTGSVKVKGRFASLLEVGTGFHPELTGRENIYLNGAILGMRKFEITNKLDEIVAFAGVERYIDTPVKRYSSGMYVRLAFAVAAHLESEILIIDEVLAVGDYEFQQKCLGKMNELSRESGRTVLFVSHNIPSIKQLCNKAILLENGNLNYLGTVEDTLNKYLSNKKFNTLKKDISQIKNRTGNQDVVFSDVFIYNNKNERLSTIFTGDDLNIKIIVDAKKNINNVSIGISFHQENHDMLSYLYSGFQNKLFNFSKGQHTVNLTIRKFSFNFNKINFLGRIISDEVELDFPREELMSFEVEQGDYFNTGRIPDLNKLFLIDGEWFLDQTD